MFKGCNHNYKRSINIKRRTEEIYWNDENMRDVLQDTSIQSSKIEIVNRNGQLEWIYFPKLPHHHFQSNEVKEKFLEEVERTNA